MQWMLIANACAARLVAVDADGRLQLVCSFENAAARLPTSRLARDRAGWAQGASHTGGSALLPHTDPHRHERERFAQELAGYLEDAARQQRFDRLDLFAAPAFLGELHGALGGATRRFLETSRPVDLTHVGWAELLVRTRQELAQPAEADRGWAATAPGTEPRHPG